MALWLAGDVHLGAGERDVLAPLGELLAGAVGIVNLEGPVGTDAAHSTAERLINDPRAVRLLPRYGVAVAAMANNHADDLGPAGQAQTRAALVAARIEPASGRDIAIVERRGVRIAVAAYDLGAGVPAHLAEELRSAAQRADVLVCAFHVTWPPTYLPGPRLREAVDIAIAAGAAVVVSHGSHAPARVERRGPAVIAWGLGNLAFACECTRESDGLILRIEASKAGVQSAAIIPIDAGLAGQPARLAEDAALMFDLLESLKSSPLSRTGDRALF